MVRSVAIGFAVLSTLTLTSSNAAPWVPPLAVGYQELLSHREVTLYYPGSRLLNFGGHGEYPRRCQQTLSLMCVPANVPASADSTLAADVTASDDIFFWYQEQLLRRGWGQGSSNADETRIYERAPGEAFRLTVYGREPSPAPLGGTEPRITYTISYSLERCPSIDAGCRTSFEPVLPSTVQSDAFLDFPRSVTMASEGCPSRPSCARMRAYVVAPTASRDAVVAWYDRTMSSNGWAKGGSMASMLEYRRGSHGLVVTFTLTPLQLGYSITGAAYTVLYSIDTCSGQPQPVCR